MPNTLSLIIAAGALIAGLIFPPLSSYTAVYVVMSAMLLGGIVFRSHLGAALRHRAYLAVILALALFAVTLPFVWHGPDDLLIIVAMLPVLLSAGLVGVLDLEPRFGSPLVIGGLCLAGAAGAVAAGLNDIYALGLARASSGNNPIHFADLSMTLGFFSLVGLFGTRSRWRLVFLAGPLLGLEAAILSETRGAVLAFIIVAIPVALMLFAWFRHIRPMTVAALVAMTVVAGGLFFLTPGISNRALSALSDTGSAITVFFDDDFGATATDEVDASTGERLALIHGAIGVFRDHPIVGVGVGQIFEAARAYFPPRYSDMGNHLHSDLGDFVASAGIFGLAGYLLLLAAPFLRPPGHYGEDRRHAMLLGAVTLSGCYFALGLTNAMFGILPQTMLFGVLLVLIVAMGRTAPAQNDLSRKQL